MCGEDVSEEMGSDEDRFAGSRRERQTMEKKTQQARNILGIEVAQTPIWGRCPLKKVWFSDQIIGFVAKHLRRHHGNASTMSSLKHFGNLFEVAYRHVADEKKLPLTFMLVAFGQELLDKHANFTACWLLVFQLIDDDSLKTSSTHLKQFAHAAAIGQCQRCQRRSKKCSSVERFRVKKNGPSASPGPSNPSCISIGRGQDA